MKLSEENLTEIESVNRAKDGDMEAVTSIVEQYGTFVKGSARGYYLIGADTEDLIQEGMIGLMKAIKDYDDSKASSFRSFASLCIKRQMITAVIKANRQKHMPLNSYVSLNKPLYESDADRTVLDIVSDSEASDPELVFIAKENEKELQFHFRNKLSSFEYEVLQLYLEGKSYVDIADALDKTPKSVDNAVQRIKKKLEEKLSEF